MTIRRTSGATSG